MTLVLKMPNLSGIILTPKVDRGVGCSRQMCSGRNVSSRLVNSLFATVNVSSKSLSQTFYCDEMNSFHEVDFGHEVMSRSKVVTIYNSPATHQIIQSKVVTVMLVTL